LPPSWPREPHIDNRFSIPALKNLPDGPRAYLVGGSVRDLLLGRPPVDLDIAVAGDPAGYARTIAARTATRVVAMGKPGQTVYRVASREMLIDVSPLKNDRIEDDLAARDFTVNAMAWDLGALALVDPLSGREDLAARCIRMVAPQAFENDPLRLLRAYRMAAALDFDVEDDTRKAVQQRASLIRRPAGERLRVELLQLLGAPDSTRLIEMMAADGLLTALFPEMQAMIGCRQNEHHDFDVFEHTLRAYAALEALVHQGGALSSALANRYTEATPTAAVLKYAMLLHDIGKPPSRRVAPDGRVRFLGHADRSTQLAANISQRLRLSRQEAQQAETIIRLHLRPLDLFAAHRRQAAGPKAIHRFFRDSYPWSVDILLHALGDRRGKRKVAPEEDDGFKDFVVGLIEYHDGSYQTAKAAAPLVSGHDLMRDFNLAPGPAIGELLARIEEERLAGSLKTREAALEFVRRKLEV
jgi:tRNA nucleotidyltransferase/poly(A) polymerase